jgi:hypothetical protein
MVPPPSKLGPARKISIVKIAQPKAKPGPQGTSEIELALAKPNGVSKKFRLLDVTAPSCGLDTRGLAMTHVERTARMPTFNNLDDDLSPDVHETPSPKKIGETRAFPPPLVSGDFLRFGFALLPQVLMATLQVLPGFRLHRICC